MRCGPAASLLVALTVAAPAASSGARGGAVVAGEADAVRVGVEILIAGGNAVDAAVATALALAVVHPEAGNLGGGGFALVRMGGEAFALDFRETAPAAAHAAMFLDASGAPRPDASRVGPLAAGVPGSPAGYFELHRRFGALPWPRVVAPAIALAEQGFELSARTARHLAEERDLLARFPETAALWLPGGQPPGEGTRWRLPATAATLHAYAAQGPAAIVEGRLAAAVEAASRRHGGVLRAADLGAYRPLWRAPLRGSAFGWELATVPLPSSGGVIVLETLGLLERLDWRALPAGGAERAHRLAEGFRRAFADRFLLGDPAASRATPEALLAPARLDGLARALSLRRATSSRALRAATPTAEPEHTTHLSVIDTAGNAAAVSTTLNDLFGCGLWVPEAGFFLNDEMDDFTTAPGLPNEYGLIQGEANSPAPGRRMLSSMAPTLAWRGAEIVALGGRGGGRIPTAVTQVLLALWQGDDGRAAVARPRVHHQWLPDRLEWEAGALDAAARAELARRGHQLIAAPLDRLPKVSLARRRADGTFEAAGDARGPEAAAVLGGAPGGEED